ncbi:MAG: hypothetical protein M1370_09755, partial [Bacteroidetes bacterium]|nr:hypothetical protein [Bacteroidota bacterium]
MPRTPGWTAGTGGAQAGRTGPGWSYGAGWLAYAVASALALLSHYYTGFVLLAQAAYCGGVFWRRRRGLVWWAASQALVLLLIAPWLAYAWPALLRTAGLVSRASFPLEAIAQRVALAFSLGVSVSKEEAAWLVPLFLALAALGAAALPMRRRSLLPLYLGVPIVATYLVSFTPMRDWPRYFIMASPAYYG